jgi:transaldolase
LIEKLSNDGLSLNVTAILPIEQVENVINVTNENTPIIISVFAGRIADTGRDPIPYIKKAVEIVKRKKNAELLWASSRELLNLFQAEECGCHIITITNDILKKLKMVGKDLNELSLDTVKMFYNDAFNAGYKI